MLRDRESLLELQIQGVSHCIRNEQPILCVGNCSGGKPSALTTIDKNMF